MIFSKQTNHMKNRFQSHYQANVNLLPDISVNITLHKPSTLRDQIQPSRCELTCLTLMSLIFLNLFAVEKKEQNLFNISRNATKNLRYQWPQNNPDPGLNELYQNVMTDDLQRAVCINPVFGRILRVNDNCMTSKSFNTNIILAYDQCWSSVKGPILCQIH